jgi:5-methylcytosine-specific restriction endonuclease McrA
VLDTNKQPWAPVHPAAARRLLTEWKAAGVRRFPFTIILKAASPTEPAALRLKLDPGSTTTGIAVVDDATGEVVFAAELHHRGQAIRDRLQSRAGVRRNRRARKTRYRKPRFLNRRRPAGWLAPSLQHRVETVMTWVARLRARCHITALSMELVRFDTQLLQDAEISGVAYQQGELAGYEVREYLLEKWHRCCAYCGVTGVPLEIEHMTPRSRGGSDRITNLTLACHACNQRKGRQTAAEFGFPELEALGRKPLKDAAAVNSTRWALYRRLLATGLPVETGTGGRTTYNRTRRNLPKTHWLDAACVGASTPETIWTRTADVLQVTATGHGNRQMAGVNASGVPIRHRQRQTTWFGFQTGDLVQAVVPAGKYAGRHVGRVAVRSRPSFKLNGFDAHPKYMRAIQRKDGYGYTTGSAAHSPVA